MKRMISAINARIDEMEQTEEGRKELGGWAFGIPLIALEVFICINEVFFA